MKKIIALFLTLLLIPTFTFAENPSPKTPVFTKAPIEFEEVTSPKEILQIYNDLPTEGFESYLWVDALKITINKKCGITEWNISFDVTMVDDVKAVLIGEEALFLDTEVENDTVFVDFSEVPTGKYYLCFFVKSVG